MQNKQPGFMIDNFLITFPAERDFVEENEDGTMAIIVDIYRVEAGKQIPVEQSEITPELEEKIGAFVNDMLTEAIEKAEKSSKKATDG
jgi:hypothetical protein